MVRVVMAVPIDIFILLLGADGWRHGGLSIVLIKDVVTGFFSHQDSVLLDVGMALIDLASNESQKAPSTISIGHLMHVGC
jgi:hypothetical protein